MHKYFLCLALFVTGNVNAQDRISTTINSNWLFYKGDTTKKAKDEKWAMVSIPHTWNAYDVNDEEAGYYRGEGWYKKTIYVPSNWKEKDVYLFFEGVGQVAEIYINGSKVGIHRGSYNAFSFGVSQYLSFAPDKNMPNEILVKVDNRHNENIPPLSGDYSFFGGIYRDVYLKAINKVHFDADNYASSGVFITTPSVNSNNATVQIKGAFVNNSQNNRKIMLSQHIYDASGKLFGEQKKEYNVAAGQKLDFAQDFNNIKGYHLWSIDDPYLYKVVSTITDAENNQKLDEVNNPLGFRWFSFDANKGFFLNGKPLKLVGASRHQDFKNMGNALTDDMHLNDVKLLKQMGGNFLRIAHYPQDQTILEACDRLGILTSIESPIMNRITETEEFTNNSKMMHLEMIRQNYNHPSLIIWTYMNEILLMPRYNRGSEEQENYFKAVNKLAVELEELTRSEDSIRYTLIPNHGLWDLYNKVGITQIPKLVGWNLYLGWYSGTVEDFGKFLDKHHAELPDKPLLITEYGSDADARLHSFSPVKFDKTVEYTTAFHQRYLKDMLDRPFVAAAMIWNLAEFNAEQRSETTPHINAKGIMTWDRKPKDAYRFYQANLLKRPYISIGSKEWSNRTGFAVSDDTLVCRQPFYVFSNQNSVSLKHNGKFIGTAKTDLGIAKFEVPLINGINYITASGNEKGVFVTDEAVINCTLLSQKLNNKVLPFDEMNISLGDKRFYFNEKTGQTWIPEQEYKAGSWGYVGGQIYVIKGSTRTGYGATKDILGTEDEPIFQTQRTGIQQFKFDVPGGKYDVILHFSELVSPERERNLAYNLGNAAAPEEFKERSFNVNVNGQEVISGLSNLQYLKPLHAVSIKYSVNITNENGLTIDFKPLTGEAILNGIQLKKVY